MSSATRSHGASPRPIRRLGRAGLVLVLALAVLVGLGVWMGPKVLRKLSGSNLHQVWVIERHQEVERYGEALAVLDGLRLEEPPAAHGIGRLLPDLPLDFEGSPTRLEALTANGPVVFAHRAPDGPRFPDRGVALAALQAEHEDVTFVQFVSGADATAAVEAVRQEAERIGFTAPLVADPSGALGRALGLETTSDVFLVDGGRTLVYRGALDDSQPLDDGAASARRTFLADALRDTLRSRPVVLSATRGLGAPLALPASDSTPAATPPTWHGSVQRIVQRNCQSCHNADGAAPFSLETYKQVRSRRSMIELVVEERSMPPWMATPDSGPWRNGLSLPEDQRQELLDWVAAGAPEGDPSDAAVDLAWPAWDEWVIGEPDYIVSAEDPIPIPAEGIIPIQKFTVSVPFPEDRWVQAIQLLPSTRGVLHHATIFMQPPDSKRLLFLDALLPGKTPTSYPEGQARFVPKGTRFKFIIHYTPNGEVSEDLLRLGLKYAEGPPFREVHSIWMTNNQFVVPAYAEDHEVTAEFVLPRDVLIKQFMPHMHLRGKSFLAEAILPGGDRIELLNLPRWNLDWQYAYELYQPLLLPEGTTVLCTGTYDNSANNPENPDPSRDVPFGQQTFDEMLGFGMDFVDP